MENDGKDGYIPRRCLRDLIPEISLASSYLDEAGSAFLVGDYKRTENLIRMADMPIIRDWTESIWGKNSPYLMLRPIPNSPKILPKEERVKVRMPTAAEKRMLHKRDGYHCRFCCMTVIRKEIRIGLQRAFPSTLQWGKTNATQHAAFQAMWAQYDHILPHSKGGDNSLDNILVTCAPCNFGRMDYTLEEVGLIDPRNHKPFSPIWDGLERLSDSFLNKSLALYDAYK